MGGLQQQAAHLLCIEKSIILGLNLEVCFGVSAYGAHFGSHLAKVQVTAVAALPDAIVVAAEHHATLHVLQQLLVARLVSSLNLGYHFKHCCDFHETLLTSLFGHCGVHIGPLVVLACGSIYKILGCALDAVYQLEPKFSVLLLLVGCLLEDSCYLLKTILFSFACVICIFFTCLALTCVRCPLVSLGLCSFQ